MNDNVHSKVKEKEKKNQRGFICPHCKSDNIDTNEETRDGFVLYFFNNCYSCNCLFTAVYILDFLKVEDIDTSECESDGDNDDL